ncbi:uncharacterized protein METZ01_LOCUS121247, partial [marine metagenome]
MEKICVLAISQYAGFEIITKKKYKMKNTIILIAICLSAVITTKAETEVEKEVKQLILDNNAYALKNLEFKAKMISKEGALEFWSSGGLLQSAQQNDKVRKFETFNTHPKHIKIIEINATTAVAMYYVEGNVQHKGSENNANYLTRVMQVYVK